MPLKAGKRKATIRSNIREFSHGATYERTRKKFGAKQAHKQAVAVALSNARKSRKG